LRSSGSTGSSHGSPSLKPAPGSLLSLYRRLVEFRRGLSGSGFELVESPPGILAYKRGAHSVVLNLGPGQAAIPLAGRVQIAVGAGVAAPSEREELPAAAPLAPACGVVLGLA